MHYKNNNFAFIEIMRYFLIYLIDLILGIIEIIIGARFILRLLGANPSSPFVQWIYANSQGLIHPFEGAFPTPTFTGGFVIEFSSLLALIVYGVIGFFLLELLARSTHTTPPADTTK